MNVSGGLFFSSDDGSHGDELWRSDGTRRGTRLARDIAPGADGSGPGGLTNVNGTLFFDADDGRHGDELWRSDGTARGTRLVSDIDPGRIGSEPLEFTAGNGARALSARGRSRRSWGRVPSAASDKPAI